MEILFNINENKNRCTSVGSTVVWWQCWWGQKQVITDTEASMTQTSSSPTSKTGFGQVKIMKEFAWMNRIFFLNFAFGQVGENN